MAKSKKNPKVDAYIGKIKKWREETEMLRAILLGFQLTEELKWGKPCYAFGGRNVVIIIGLKESCVFGFVKGVLLKDAAGILSKPGQHTQAMRQIRFTNARDIAKLTPVLKAYIKEAIEVEKAGLEVSYKKEPEPIPEELQNKLDEIPALKTAFAALTLGRQRAYILFFSAAKQSKTRESRIEKYMPRIFDGRGLAD